MQDRKRSTRSLFADSVTGAKIVSTRRACSRSMLVQVVRIAALMLALALPALSQAPADGPWYGSIQCPLNIEQQGYVRHEIQTWTLASPTPTSKNGAMQIYPATWTVTGQGGIQKIQGERTSMAQWNINAPAVNATIAMFVRASDGQFIIRIWQRPVPAYNTLKGARQMAISGVAQQPTTVSSTVSEWMLPWIATTPGENIKGKFPVPTESLGAELTPIGALPTAECTWQFSHSAVSTVGDEQSATNTRVLKDYTNSTQQSWKPQGSGGIAAGAAGGKAAGAEAGAAGVMPPSSTDGNAGVGAGAGAGGKATGSGAGAVAGGAAMPANATGNAGVAAGGKATGADASAAGAMPPSSTDGNAGAAASGKATGSGASTAAMGKDTSSAGAAAGGASAGASASSGTASLTPDSTSGIQIPSMYQAKLAKGVPSAVSNGPPSTTITMAPVPLSTVKPALTAVAPATGQQGQNLTVTLIATNTNFVQGQTTADFGPGITVANLSVTSPTTATATINIDPAAAPKVRTVKLTTNSEIAYMSTTNANGEEVHAGFTVVQANTRASLTSASPNSAGQGRQGLTVALTAANTHFAQGVTTASFDKGITVSSLTVTSPTTAEAIVNVDPSSLGLHSVVLTTGTEYARLENLTATNANGETIHGGFMVTKPALTTVTPNAGQQGQNLSVTLTATNTTFAQGLTTADFGPGITVAKLSVTSPTTATATINIDPAAVLKVCTVALTTNGEIAYLSTTNANGEEVHAGFTVTPGLTVTVNPLLIVPSLPGISQISPNSAPQESAGLTVTLTGFATHFAQGSTTADFGPGITVSRLTIDSQTQATALLNIDVAAASTARRVTLTTGSEVAGLANGFTVNVPPPPAITNVFPNSAEPGETNVSVNITAQSTHFVQGTTVLDFGPGVTVSSLRVTSRTSATAVLNFAASGPASSRTVTATTGTEIAKTGYQQFSVTYNPGQLLQISPQEGQQAQQLALQITGSGTHFSPSTTVSIGGCQFNGVQVTSRSQATAHITCPSNSPLGLQNVSVTSNGHAISLNSAFTVTPAPDYYGHTLSAATSIGMLAENATRTYSGVLSGAFASDWLFLGFNGDPNIRVQMTLKDVHLPSDYVLDVFSANSSHTRIGSVYQADSSGNKQLTIRDDGSHGAFIQVHADHWVPTSANYTLSLLAYWLQPTDTWPDPFSFSTTHLAVPLIDYGSNTVTIRGINTDVPISVSGGASYSINGGTFTYASGTVHNGDTVSLHGHLSVLDTSMTTDVRVGDYTASWTLTRLP